MRLIALGIVLAAAWNPLVMANEPPHGNPSNLNIPVATTPQQLLEIRNAITALKAGGLNTAATELQDQYDQHVQRLSEMLDSKTRELEMLHSEVQRIQESLGLQRSLCFSAQIYEIEFGKLENADPVTAAQLREMISGTSAETKSAFGLLLLTGESAAKLRNAVETTRQAGRAKLLAEPVLHTRPGSPARFFQGGEFPVPVRQALGGNVVVEWEEFGLSLKIVPQVCPLAQLETRCEFEQSECDDKFGATLNGFRIPGKRIRNFQVVTKGTIDNQHAFVLDGKGERSLFLFLKATNTGEDPPSRATVDP